MKSKQAEKLQSREMKEGWLKMMKDEWRMMKDEGRVMKDEWGVMKDDDFKLLRGFEDEQTDGQTEERTDICDCRVTFATEKALHANVSVS